MLSGGRGFPPPLYPRPSEPGEREPEEPYDPRFSAAPLYERPAGPSAEPPDDERGGIGVNFCQPPLLAPPPSRPDGEFTGLLGRGAEPQLELPRVSPVERPSGDAPSPDRPNSREPGSAERAVLFRFSNPRWLPVIGVPPFDRMVFVTCACSRSNAPPPGVMPVPCGEKKCSFPPRLTTVPGAADRPLGLRL